MIKDDKIPQIDSPEHWAVGKDIYPELLRLYTHYPVKLKCEVVALCLKGTVEAQINLNKINAAGNDLVWIPAGSIIQMDSISQDIEIYYLAFSEKFINTVSSQNVHYIDDQSLANKSIECREDVVKALSLYFETLISVSQCQDKAGREAFANNVYSDIKLALKRFTVKKIEEGKVSREQKICRDFYRLVMNNYTKTRNIEWYAEQLGFSHTHLSSVVKRATGKTCSELIANMVINDTKSRLKLTNQTIQQIADDLNFADMSFFCKYFKRYTGMTPMQWRNHQD